MIEQCSRVYNRQLPNTHHQVRCTFLAGHKGRCSFYSLQLQDDLEVQPGAPTGLPNDVSALLAAISEGHADPYLEAILAVAHGRKRALRNVPGFPRQRHNGGDA